MQKELKELNTNGKQFIVKTNHEENAEIINKEILLMPKQVNRKTFYNNMQSSLYLKY